MRKLLVTLCALALLSTWMALPVGARTRLSCQNPTHMAMVNGSYTTSSTIQYNSTDFVQMDAWSPDSTLQQTMDVCSVGEWDATVTETSSSNPRVVTYPDSEYRFTDYVDCSHSPDWSTFNHLSSTYALTGSGSAGDWDKSYDVFFGGTINGHNCGTFREVMVYTKWHGNVFAPAALANFTTADGQNYDVWWNVDASYIQVRQTTQTSSGMVHLGQVFGHLSTLGVLGAHDLLQFIQYGVEVISGVDTAADGPLSFHLTDFSVTAN